MTRESVQDGRRAEDSLSRFKDRTALVAVGLLGLVLLVFLAGMATAYVRDSWARFAVTSSERHVHAERTAAGTYAIEAWHAKLGMQTVKVSDTQPRNVSFTLET